MNNEIYLEGFRVDVSKELSSLLTFTIDDVRDFSERATTFSKTIILPGTANNNKNFGHIYQFGQANPYNPATVNIGFNFNASKSASCIIFQNQMQTFKGVMRLMQININKGCIDYEVAVFGEITSLNVALMSGKLEYLDFSAYDHTYDKDAIIDSWDNPGGSGVYYPHADYGNYSIAKHDWQFGTFRPALYVKEYIDKMFAAAGFRYECALFNTARFKSEIIPHNQKRLTRRGSDVLSATVDGPKSYYVFLDTGDPSSPDFRIRYDNVSTTNFTMLGGGTIFRYDDPAALRSNITVPIKGSWSYPSFGNGIVITLYHFDYSTSTETALDSRTFLYSDGVFDFTFSVTALLLGQNDLVYVNVSPYNYLLPPIEYTVIIDATSFTMVSEIPQTLNVNYGDPCLLNDTIPKNIRQSDFLVGIVKMNNLYVYEDRFDTRLIHITPFIDFYSTNSANSLDWSYKLNRDKVLKVKPLSEINAKKYEFKFKADNDYFNELYRKRYGEGYGDFVFDSVFEFATQTKTAEVIFSATPLVGYAGEDKIYPTIFKRTGSDETPGVNEEPLDSNIRIMLSKKVTGVSSWRMFDGSTVLATLTDYGYAGHLDDPDAPASDLNFGALRELFFILATGNLSATQFNLYWSSYMAEITDKDSKLLTGNFYLTAKDIFELDFSKFIYLDGVLFRLNKITDYNVTKPADCQVQLLKVNYLIY